MDKIIRRCSAARLSVKIRKLGLIHKIRVNTQI